MLITHTQFTYTACDDNDVKTTYLNKMFTLCTIFHEYCIICRHIQLSFTNDFYNYKYTYVLGIAYVLTGEPAGPGGPCIPWIPGVPSLP